MLTRDQGVVHPTAAVARDAARAVHVTWSDGREDLFHYLWLRDNCPHPCCRHANGQRLIETRHIPADIAPLDVRLTDAGELRIDWSHENHVSRYAPAYLAAHRYTNAANHHPCSPTAGSHPAPHVHPAVQCWTASSFTRLPRHDYHAIIADDDALTHFLRDAATLGFALLRNVPRQSGMVTKVVELFGHVRQTNYGKFFELRSVTNPDNLANSALTLGGHTDNPYREPPPTLQLLHCLANSAPGGDSTLVDGFSVALALHHEAPDLFNRLTQNPIRFHYQNVDSDLAAEAPVVRLNPRGRIEQVRFNNRSVAPFDLPADIMLDYYRAYCRFADMMENDANRINFKLQPGDLMLMDNRRVLHGRSGFTGAGSRHLQGCYADVDGLLSRLAVLQREELST